eukprot:s620_g1.t1
MLQFAIRYRLQTCSQEQKKRKRSGEIEALSLPTVAKYFGTMLQFAIRYRLQTCSQEQKKRKRSGEIEALSLPTVAKYFGRNASESSSAGLAEKKE